MCALNDISNTRADVTKTMGKQRTMLDAIFRILIINMLVNTSLNYIPMCKKVLLRLPRPFFRVGRCETS